MSRLYWFVNKPWESIPILMRAIKMSQHSRRLNDAAHIQWAHSLLGRPPVICDDGGPEEELLPYKPPLQVDERGEQYRVVCGRKP